MCIEEYANRLPIETPGDLVDGKDEAWRLLEPYNIYDIQLYKYARTVFRSETQTIVPFQKQLKLFGGTEAEGEKGK